MSERGLTYAEVSALAKLYDGSTPTVPVVSDAVLRKTLPNRTLFKMRLSGERQWLRNRILRVYFAETYTPSPEMSTLQAAFPGVPLVQLQKALAWAEESALLRHLYRNPKKPPTRAELAATFPHRTYGYLYRRQQYIGIHARNRAWTPEEEAILRESWALQTPRTILVKLPHRTWSAIRDHARTLGLSTLAQGMALASDLARDAGVGVKAYLRVLRVAGVRVAAWLTPLSPYRSRKTRAWVVPEYEATLAWDNHRELQEEFTTLSVIENDYVVAKRTVRRAVLAANLPTLTLAEWLSVPDSTECDDADAEEKLQARRASTQVVLVPVHKGRGEGTDRYTQVYIRHAAAAALVKGKHWDTVGVPLTTAAKALGIAAATLRRCLDESKVLPPKGQRGRAVRIPMATARKLWAEWVSKTRWSGQQADPSEPVFNIATHAARLRVGKDHLLRLLRRRGVVPPSRSGKEYLLPVSVVDREFSAYKAETGFNPEGVQVASLAKELNVDLVYCLRLVKRLGWVRDKGAHVRAHYITTEKAEELRQLHARIGPRPDTRPVREHADLRGIDRKVFRRKLGPHLQGLPRCIPVFLTDRQVREFLGEPDTDQTVASAA